MAPLTRNMSKDLRNRLVQTILDREGEDKFSEGLKRLGVTEFEDLISMDPADIELIKFPSTDPNSNLIVLSDPTPADKRILVLFLQWVTLKKSEGAELTHDEWNSLDRDGFNEFRVSQVNPFETFMATRISNRSNGTNDTAAIKHKQEVDTFKRSIKRDATIYPTLREDHAWDSWNRNVLTLAHTHDVSEVFDSDYSPKDELEQELFDQKQGFVYSVFVRTILTDMGKTIVRNYEKTYNAQQVYKDLVSYAKKSTAANINIENIVHQLQNVKLDTRWTGTTKGFILNWRDKMRLYEELTPEDEHYKDGQKKRMLETSVNHILELRQIKTQDEYAKATGGISLTYLEYVELLLSAATRRDAELKLPPQRSRLNVNVMDTHYEFDQPSPSLDNQLDYGQSYEDAVNGSDDYVNYVVNVANTNSSFIPKELQDQLPNEARVQLIKARGSNNGNRNYNHRNSPDNLRGIPPKPSNTSYPSRQTNVHMTEDVKNCGNYYGNGECSSNTAGPSSHGPNLQVNQSEQTAMHPGDIRNVLTSASKPTKKPSMQVGSPKKTLVIDGTTYYAATTTVLVDPNASTCVLPRFGSLVDRGANIGIAGDDVLLIKTSHKTCGVVGIGNHAIEGLPIATCAGLVKTVNGNVIVILNQYAYSGKGSTIHSAVQLELMGNLVDDKSKLANGKQHIVTVDKHTLDLSICNGLAYLEMTKPTLDQYHSLPHVVLTSDLDWNPNVLDNKESSVLGSDKHLPNLSLKTLDGETVTGSNTSSSIPNLSLAKKKLTMNFANGRLVMDEDSNQVLDKLERVNKLDPDPKANFLVCHANLKCETKVEDYEMHKMFLAGNKNIERDMLQNLKYFKLLGDTVTFEEINWNCFNYEDVGKLVPNIGHFNEHFGDSILDGLVSHDTKVLLCHSLNWMIDKLVEKQNHMDGNKCDHRDGNIEVVLEYWTTLRSLLNWGASLEDVIKDECTDKDKKISPNQWHYGEQNGY